MVIHIDIFDKGESSVNRGWVTKILHHLISEIGVCETVWNIIWNDENKILSCVCEPMRYRRGCYNHCGSWGPDEYLHPTHFCHDNVIKWKPFPRYFPFVRGIHRSPVNSPHKGQWRGALMFSLICVWINNWVYNREAGDLRRYRAHYDVIVMVHVISIHFLNLKLLVFHYHTIATYLMLF